MWMFLCGIWCSVDTKIIQSLTTNCDGAFRDQWFLRAHNLVLLTFNWCGSWQLLRTIFVPILNIPQHFVLPINGACIWKQCWPCDLDSNLIFFCIAFVACGRCFKLAQSFKLHDPPFVKLWHIVVALQSMTFWPQIGSLHMKWWQGHLIISSELSSWVKGSHGDGQIATPNAAS